VNFCLRTSDRALSGPSRSKLLNELSNDVFRALVIGYYPLAQEALDRFPEFRATAQRTSYVLDLADAEQQGGEFGWAQGTQEEGGVSEEDAITAMSNADLRQSLRYADYLESLLRGQYPGMGMGMGGQGIGIGIGMGMGPGQEQEQGQEGEEAGTDQVTGQEQRQEEGMGQGVGHEQQGQGQGQGQGAELGPLYDKGYRRLLTALGVGQIQEIGQGMGLAAGGMGMGVVARRPPPRDRDICLSILDGQVMRAGRAKADAARAAASAASAAFAIAFSDASTAASLALLAAGSGSVADKVAAETAEAAAALSAAAFADSSGSGTASAAAAAFSATSGFSSAAFSSVSTAGFTTPTTPTAEPYPSDMYQDAFGAHTSKTIELNRVANSE
ncbi:hypothetical protein B484DRAFT_399128, partial [Ochromonadaceae sp. CCMP2298]